MDYLSYYLNRLWEVAPWPVGFAMAASFSLMPITKRIPGWIRVDLSAVYLPITLCWAAVLGVNFAPVNLAHNIVAGVLVVFGASFSVFRFRQQHCWFSGALFGLGFTLLAVVVAFNLHRHYIIHSGQ